MPHQVKVFYLLENSTKAKHKQKKKQKRTKTTQEMVFRVLSSHKMFLEPLLSGAGDCTSGWMLMLPHEGHCRDVSVTI
jgi:hypothetical protein